jgi:hypothetical protein
MEKKKQEMEEKTREIISNMNNANQAVIGLTVSK